MSGEQSRGI
jgi:hypothetical protein